MKKLLITTLFFALFSVSPAQFIKGFGIKAGGTSSQQNHERIYTFGTYNDNIDSRIGFNFGVFGEFLNTPVFSLVAELNYVEKGFQKYEYFALIDLDETDSPGTLLNLKLNYINFSALAKIRLQGNICTPYIFLGPKLDVELNESYNYYPSYKYYPYGLGMSEYSKVRFGFKTGIGTEIYLFGINFLAEFIYDKDLGYLYETRTLRISSYALEFRGGISVNL